MNNEFMSQDISKLSESLSKAKAAFGPILKNKTVKTKSFSYDYADLSSIEDTIKIPMMENGLVIMQPMIMVGAQRVLVTILSHVSGQWIKGEIPLSSNTIEMQTMGKEITYLRRYSLCSILGITPEDDTDGNEEAGKDKISSKRCEDRIVVRSEFAVENPLAEIKKRYPSHEPDMLEKYLKICSEKKGWTQEAFAQAALESPDLIEKHYDKFLEIYKAKPTLETENK